MYYRSTIDTNRLTELKANITPEQRELSGINESFKDACCWTLGLDCFIKSIYIDRLNELYCNNICEKIKIKLEDTKIEISKTHEYLMRKNEEKTNFEIFIKQTLSPDRAQPLDPNHANLLKLNYDRCCHDMMVANNDLNRLVYKERECMDMIRTYTYRAPIEKDLEYQLSQVNRIKTILKKKSSKVKKIIEERFNDDIYEDESLLTKEMIYRNALPEENIISTSLNSPYDDFVKHLQGSNRGGDSGNSNINHDIETKREGIKETVVDIYLDGSPPEVNGMERYSAQC